MPRWAFVVVATVGALAVGALIAAVAGLLPLLFLGILLGVLVDAVARALGGALHVRRRRMARLVVVVGLATLAFALAVGVPLLAAELARFVGAVPAIVEEVGRTSWGAWLLALVPPEALEPDGPAAASLLGPVAGGTVGAALALALGALLGVAPGRHLAPFARALPEEARPVAREVVDAVVDALRRWLVGRVVDMTLLGTSMALGLHLLGVPWAVPLGALGGALEFVPYIGPSAALLPAVFVALGEHPSLVPRVVALHLGLQLVQSYVVTPLIEQRAVHVSPAWVLTVQAVMGVTGGAVAVLVAVPTIVVAIVTVQVLWLRRALGDPVRLLGEPG